MIPIVADTMVLRYLIVIEAVHLLPVLYTHVMIPPEVAAELQRPRTPERVRTWMRALPPWLTVRSPRLPPDPTLSRLGTGEHEALLLMQEGTARLPVTDDRSAVSAARARSIPVIRTLRVLEYAAEQGLVELPDVLGRLREAGFYMPEAAVIEELLTRDAERKRQGSNPA